MLKVASGEGNWVIVGGGVATMVGIAIICCCAIVAAVELL